MKTVRVILSGGGTGGHLYPALVLAEKLRELRPGVEIIHVGSRRPAELRIMAAGTTRFVAMRIEGLKGRGLRSLGGLLLLPGAFVQTLLLLLRFRPALVVGVGGFSSGPVVLLAAWAGIPTLVLEQNVRPGFTNRLLARWVRRAAVAFQATLPAFRGKGLHLGNPVRPAFTTLPPKARDGRLSLLVCGGSQGSAVLNRAVVTALPLLAPVRGRLELVHQTGVRDVDAVRREYAQNGFAAVVEPFFEDMPARFEAADLVLGRAGATTCAELAAAGKASILVPFAGAAENHQALNAAALERAGGAEVLPEKALNPLRLAERIRWYLSHPEALTAMELAVRRLAKPRAAEDIAALALRLLDGGGQE